MEHLACYLPGNLALGVAEGAVGGEKALQYAGVAEELTHTCQRMYEIMPTGRQYTFSDACSIVHLLTYRLPGCDSLVQGHLLEHQNIFLCLFCHPSLMARCLPGDISLLQCPSLR
jgi:hypothetical protein